MLILDLAVIHKYKMFEHYNVISFLGLNLNVGVIIVH